MLNQLFPGLGDMLGGGQGSQDQDNGQGQQGGQATPAPDNGSGSQASPSSLSLVEVPSPPKGYTQSRSTARTAEKGGQLEGTQLIVLEGDSGQITVAAERSDTDERQLRRPQGQGDPDQRPQGRGHGPRLRLPHR